MESGDLGDEAAPVLRGNPVISALRETFAYQFMQFVLPLGAAACYLSAAAVCVVYQVVPVATALGLVLVGFCYLGIRYLWLPRAEKEFHVDLAAFLVFALPSVLKCFASYHGNNDSIVDHGCLVVFAALAFIRSPFYCVYVVLAVGGQLAASYWTAVGLNSLHYTFAIIVPVYAFIQRVGVTRLSNRAVKATSQLQSKVDELVTERARREKTEMRLAEAAGETLASHISLDMTNLLVMICDATEVLDRFDQLRREGITNEQLKQRILETDFFDELMEKFQLIEVNDRLVEVIGADSQAHAVAKFRDTIVAESIPEYRNYFVELVYDREFKAQNVHRHLVTGEPIYFQIQSRLVRVADMIYGIAALSDVTEQAHLKKQVEQSETRLQMALGTSQSGIFEVDVPTMRLTFDNAYYELLGYPLGALDGAVSNIRNLVHPDDIEESQNLTSNLFAGKLRSVDRTHRMLMHDGIYRWFRMRMKPAQFDSDGQAVVAVGTLVDVHQDVCTDRLLRLERDILARSGEVSELLLDLGEGIEREWEYWRCGILLFNMESNTVSQCIAPSLGTFLHSRLCGGSIDEVLGSCRNAINSKEICCEPWENAFESDGVKCPEFLRSQCEFTSSAPIFFGNQIRGTIYIFHSQRPSEAEQSLFSRLAQTAQLLVERQYQEDKEAEFESKVRTEDRLDSLGKLAGGVAHDFNNLLTVMLTHSELIEMRSNDPDVIDSTNQIAEAAQMAASLCRKMLTYAGESPFELQNLDLSSLCSSVVEMVRTGTAVRHDFAVDYALDLPVLVGDQSMISQLIMNLLTNAVEASPSDGSLTIATGCAQLTESDFADMYFADQLTPGDYVFVKVEDQGDGISPDVIQKIFDPFFTTKDTGSGLGLATVIGAVRRHKGCLSLESLPGKGTAITAYLPSVGTVSVLELQCDAKRVAIVDDDEAVRMTLERMLKQRGYDVITMSSGEEAIRRIDELGRCDGLVLDQQMPGMDGLETYRAVRKELRSLPVCFVSGYKYSEELGTVVRVDSRCDLIAKPFSIKTVDNAIEGLLGVPKHKESNVEAQKER